MTNRCFSGTEQFMHRPAVMGRNGMVASAEPLATLAGVSVLQEGGNAFDAAIAVNAVLSVTEPQMCGIGGDIFYLLYNSGEKKVSFLNGSGASGSQASIEHYKSQKLDAIPLQGYQSMITVPGCVDGWCELNKKYGTMPLIDLLRFAIDYALYGFPANHQWNIWSKKNVELLSHYPSSSKIFLKNGCPYEPGEIITQEDLARTLELIAEGGREAFYEGEIAEKMALFIQANGGILVSEDFKEHRSTWGKPISTDYRGYTIYQTAPNTQGIATLLEFNIMEGYDLASLGHNSVESLHLMCEAKKLAFADRDRYVTDPVFADIPVEQLLDKNYAARLRNSIDEGSAFAGAAVTRDPRGDTTYFSVVDGKGNIVSCIQSIYFPFGSGVVVEGTGICFHNRGAYFSLDPQHINHLEPKKRTMHTLTASIVFKGDQPYLAFGTMGGDGQPQTHLSVISNIVDYGMNIQQAIEAPRWIHGNVEIGGKEVKLNLEGRICCDTINGLRKKGHNVDVLEDWSCNVGHAQGILIDFESGVLQGGADPRGGGYAMGW